MAYLFYLVLLTEQDADFDRDETQETAWFTLEGAQERIAVTAHEAASREDLVTLKLAGQAFAEESSRPKTPQRRQRRASMKSAK